MRSIPTTLRWRPSTSPARRSATASRSGSAAGIKTIAALEGPFDLVHIDAERTGYSAYLDAVLPKLAPGGFVVANSVLWKGRVLDRRAADAETPAMAPFNERIAADPRLEVVMLTIGEGLTLIRPRRPR